MLKKQFILSSYLVLFLFLIFNQATYHFGKNTNNNFVYRKARTGVVRIDSAIFRSYDVRGVVKDTENPDGTVTEANLTPEVANLIGKSLGSRIPEGSTVVISGDHRKSSKKLIDALVAGYTETGVNVKVSYTPTPTGGNNWYLVSKDLDGAVQVTGSHNPPEYNGLKISEGKTALHGEELKELIPMIKNRNFRTDAPEGSVEKVDIKTKYLNMLKEGFDDFNRDFKVVVDPHHGLGGVLVPILEKLGCEVISMNEEPRGDFPEGPADPSKEKALEDLQKKVKQTDADFGIALDGDADRSGFVDEEGTIVSPEKMAAIFYKEYLKNSGDKTPVMALDVRASNSAGNIVEKFGGKGLFIPTGYPSHRAFAKVTSDKINKENFTEVSAEASGHFFFPTAGGETLIDDGLYSALEFMQILDNTKYELSELMESVPTKPTSPEIRIYAPDDKKHEVVQEVKQIVMDKYKKELKPIIPMKGISGIKTQNPDSGLIEVSGVRAQFKDGSWFLVRPSGTSPKLSLKFEAGTHKRLVEVMSEVYEILSGFKEVKELNKVEKVIQEEKRLIP